MAKKPLPAAAGRWMRSSSGRLDLKKGLICALGIPAALFAALALAFHWKTQPEEVYAELWAAVPSTGIAPDGGPAKAAPESPPPPPAPEEKPAPAPAPRVKEAEPETPRKADIVAAEEKAKKLKEKQEQEEKARKLEEQKKLEQKKLEQQKLEQKKREELVAQMRRDAAAKTQMDRVKAAEAARVAQAAKQSEAIARARSQELARVAGGKPSKNAAGVPTGDKSARTQNLSGTSQAAFVARVRACIRPNIIFSVPSGIRRGQYRAVYSVRLLPTGDQAGAPRKTRSSGLPGFDSAVERAIALCPRFPPAGGAPVPPEVTLTFDPVDAR